MNNSRNLIILAVVLVVLGGVSLLQRTAHRKQTSRSATEVIVPETYGTDDLDRITLGYGDQEVSVDLVRDPDGWKVASAWNAPAADNRLDALLKAVSGLSGEYRSDDPDVVPDYGLADSTAVHIRCYKNGDAVVSLEVGARAKSQPGNFIRVTDSPRVFLSTVSLLSPLGIYGDMAAPKSRQFLDLQAVKEDRLAVDRIVLRDGDTTLEMHKDFAMIQPDSSDTTGAGPTPDRNTWEWSLDKPRKAALAKTKADGVLGTLVSIRAADVGDPDADPETYGLVDSSRTATLVLDDGSQVVLEFGKARESEGDHPAGTWMRVQGKNMTWVVNEYTVKNIFKNVDDLLPDTK